MDIKTYRLNKDYEIKAKKLGMNMNAYVGYLIQLAEKERTQNQAIQLSKLETLESTVQSLVTLRQSDKLALDVMTKRIGMLIDTITEQSQLFDGKLAFISKLEQELTQ